MVSEFNIALPRRGHPGNKLPVHKNLKHQNTGKVDVPHKVQEHSGNSRVQEIYLTFVAKPDTLVDYGVLGDTGTQSVRDST